MKSLLLEVEGQRGDLVQLNGFGRGRRRPVLGPAGSGFRNRDLGKFPPLISALPPRFLGVKEPRGRVYLPLISTLKCYASVDYPD